MEYQDPEDWDSSTEIECAYCGERFYYELTRCPNCGRDVYEPEYDEDAEIWGVDPDRDPFFTTSNLSLGNEARIPPPLTLTGAKLRLEWMQKVLFDGESIRPYMHTRMPQYGEKNLGHLPGLLQQVDSIEPVDMPLPEGPREKRDSTRRKVPGAKGGRPRRAYEEKNGAGERT